MPNVEVLDAHIVRNSIKQQLEKLALTQEEAARRVGVSFRHFNRMVLGEAEPTLVVAEKMAKVLGRPVSKLFEIKMVTRPARGNGQ